MGSEGVGAVFGGCDGEAGAGDGGVVGAADYGDVGLGGLGETGGVEGADGAGAYDEDVGGHCGRYIGGCGMR